MRAPSVIALVALLASAGAALADTTPAADSATAQPAAAQDKMICRTQQETGSLTRSKRICMTRQQWEDQREQQRNMLDKPRIGPHLGG